MYCAAIIGLFMTGHHLSIFRLFGEHRVLLASALTSLAVGESIGNDCNARKSFGANVGDERQVLIEPGHVARHEHGGIERGYINVSRRACREGAFLDISCDQIESNK
jgi:hypothetical protein